MSRAVLVDLNAVILTVTEEVPRILTVQRTPDSLGLTAEMAGGDRLDALPFGPLDPDGDRTLELGLAGWVREQTGLVPGYVEQLYTFGDKHRGPQPPPDAPRIISIAYLGLVRESLPSGDDASFRDGYRYFPWEDWRGGRPRLLDEAIVPELARWAGADASLRRQRRERADIVFGLEGAPWDGERVLDRYELLYEVGLVEESWRDRGRTMPASHPRLGRAMALDHRRILATAFGRLRGKLRYRPVVFELLPPAFTLLQLQRVVEALVGVRLHKQNFRRLVEKGGLVEGTGKLTAHTGGRPAELFSFRREVLRERPAPGVGLPGARAMA